MCSLRDRYRGDLPIRSGWWENPLQVEALAARVDRYDSGEWDDPPGKLALLYEIERVAALLHDGAKPFHPDRDRAAFTRHLIGLATSRFSHASRPCRGCPSDNNAPPASSAMMQ